MQQFKLNSLMAGVRWTAKGSCGNAGCGDSDCVCALCRLPIGIPEEDPRWVAHGVGDCFGCELCADQVPSMLFRGDGAGTEQAAFHHACFERLLLPEDKLQTSAKSKDEGVQA